MEDEEIAINTFSWSSRCGQKVAPVHIVFFQQVVTTVATTEYLNTITQQLLSPLCIRCSSYKGRQTTGLQDCLQVYSHGVRGRIFSPLWISASTLSIDAYFGINAEIGIGSTHSHSQPYSEINFILLVTMGEGGGGSFLLVHHFLVGSYWLEGFTQRVIIYKEWNREFLRSSRRQL